jgi:hypothetical protein
MAIVSIGDNTGMKLPLRTTIKSLRATLTLPANTEHRKLSKDTTPLSTLIHPTWLPYIPPNDLPTHLACSYNTLTKAPPTNKPTKKITTPSTPHIIPTPSATSDTPLDVLDINDHKILLKQTIYHTNQWKLDQLTAKQLCHHIYSSLATRGLTRVHPEDADTPILTIPFKVV